MKMNWKQAFAKKNEPEVEEGYVSPLSNKGEVIEEASGRDTATALALSVGGGLKFILGIILLAVFVIAAIYTALAGTLMFLAPSDSATAKVWVARGTFEGGRIDTGKTVYGSATGDASTDLIGKALEGFVGAKDYFIADVVVGPVGDLSSSKGEIYLNGKNLHLKGNIQNIRLREQYLAKCVEGSCIPGEYVVIDSSSVSGEVRGKVSLKGVTDVRDK